MTTGQPSPTVPAPSDGDRLLRFAFPRERVRGQIVQLGPAWAEVARRHRTHESREVSPNLRQRLGELTAASLLLSASLKFDGALVLQIQSQGPVGLFVVECESDGRFRATVKIREGSRIMPDASLSDLLAPLRQARFAVTLIPPTGAAAARSPLVAPYQGIVPFEGDTVAELLENYMQRSEQVPTRLWLAADDERAFGLLLQRMPGDGGQPAEPEIEEADDDQPPPWDDDGWNRILALTGTLTRDEMLRCPIEELLVRLFWESAPTVFTAPTPRFVCNCSRQKVESMLRLLGRTEVDAIVREQGLVEVRCEFCGEEYLLGADEARALFG